MSDDTREKSFREATQESQKGLIGEFWGFMSENAKWWLIPFLFTLAVAAYLTLTRPDRPTMPFQYDLPAE